MPLYVQKKGLFVPKPKKTVYTLAVDNYEPEITAITFPYMRKYAEKIEADFHIITERKFPDAPPVYEKFQIHELAQQHGNDWNIFFDADALIHPDFFDITALIGKDMTVSHGSDFVPHRFRPSIYSLRDKRMIGKGNWLAVFSDWCIDYYKPLDVPFDEVIKDIFPTAEETRFGITPCHLIDDYTVTRNIARYGLNHMLIAELDYHNVMPNMFAHQYLMRSEEKAVYLEGIIKKWGI